MEKCWIRRIFFLWRRKIWNRVFPKMKRPLPAGDWKTINVPEPQQERFPMQNACTLLFAATVWYMELLESWWGKYLLIHLKTVFYCPFSENVPWLWKMRKMPVRNRRRLSLQKMNSCERTCYVLFHMIWGHRWHPFPVMPATFCPMAIPLIMIQKSSCTWIFMMIPCGWLTL